MVDSVHGNYIHGNYRPLASARRVLQEPHVEQLVIGGQHCLEQLLGHPALIHSSRQRRKVVAEQVVSAVCR
jgi:hypothetical protein